MQGHSPCTNEDSSTHLSSDGCLVLLDEASKALGFVLPSFLRSHSDTIELIRIGVYTFLQALDLINREPVMPDEQVASCNIKVSLALENILVPTSEIFRYLLKP